MTATPSGRDAAIAPRSSAGGAALRTVVLIAATVATGLTAGVFVHWSNTIMPGLSTVGDRTFVEAFHALDAAILNPLFQGMFTVAVLLSGVSIVQHLRAGLRPVVMWVGVALVSSLLVWGITFGVHEPLNTVLRSSDELGAGAGVDVAALRARLDEARWTSWNTVRAVASTVAFGCLAWALAIHRRPTDRRHV